MEKTNDDLTEVLNDLIKINYDRIEGYRKAADDSKRKNIDLHPVFHDMANESRLNVSSLTQLVRDPGQDAESGTTEMGKIYHAWMEVKATFTGKDRESILSACEFGEDQAQHAYDTALTSAYLNTDTRMLLMMQKETLKRQQHTIKAMWDKR
jgi:uncharacterized protein (TIGR02284 family)